MAYSDYGAFVWLNDERRKDKEDVAAFATDEETFGESSENIGSGSRIFVNLLYQQINNTEIYIDHGVLGDGDIRVICYKQGLPCIKERLSDGTIQEVTYVNLDEVDPYEYDDIHFDYKDHKFYFSSGKPYYAKMETPTGDIWECKYDYGYGAGFEGENEE